MHAGLGANLVAQPWLGTPAGDGIVIGGSGRAVLLGGFGEEQTGQGADDLSLSTEWTAGAALDAWLDDAPGTSICRGTDAGSRLGRYALTRDALDEALGAVAAGSADVLLGGDWALPSEVGVADGAGPDFASPFEEVLDTLFGPGFEPRGD